MNKIQTKTNAGNPEQLEADKAFAKYCNKVLKNVMTDHEISNLELAELAGTSASNISRLRNGVLSQKNYIKIIRGLPPAARKEYLSKVFDLEIE